MSSIGRCRLCGEDVPFIVGNPVELGFHMIDRHSNGSIGQYSIDDANQLYQNRDFPESSGLSFDDSDSKSDIHIDKSRKKKKSKRRKREKAHIQGQADELGVSGSESELMTSKRKKKQVKRTGCSGSRRKIRPCYEEDDEPEEISEENELKPSESRRRRPRKKRTTCGGNRNRITCLDEEEPEEDSEEKEIKVTRSRHREPKKAHVKPTGCGGGRRRNRKCFEEDDDVIEKVACDGGRVYRERRTCGDTRRRPCGDVEIPCGATRQRRSRKRVHRTGLYKTSIEMWTKGSGNIVCPHCQKTVKPLIRNQKTKVAYTSAGAACMLGFWPFCFLFPFLHQCSIELYCSSCKQPLAAKTGGHKTKVNVPNLDTTE